ncbi:MAG: cytochrome P450, partial [Paracoccaceae bacterium]
MPAPIHSSVPVLDDIGFETLFDDPYPSFDRIRDTASAVWVPSARLNLVTRFDDIVHIERNHAQFASTNPGSLMNKIMGHSLMRKDDEPHRIERQAIAPTFRPDVAKEHWAPKLTQLADQLIRGFEDQGEADLFEAFAAPMASGALILLLGFDEDVAWQDMCLWSQSLMDAVGNYTADPDVAARGAAAATAIAREIDRVLPLHRQNHNPSVLSGMAHADPPHSLAQMRANVNVIVGGGLNEPRDAILTAIYGLLSNPDQLEQVRETPKLFGAAFEESIR